MNQTRFLFLTFTGSLSSICSMFILNIIRISPEKLSTTYHRIMALMSIFDIMASTSLNSALGFLGTIIGYRRIHQVQGFVILFGIISSVSLYMCLSWYFVCKISFKMDPLRIRKVVEPIFYFYSLTLAMFVTSYYNSSNDDLECKSDTSKEWNEILSVVKTIFGVNATMTTIAMTIVIRTVLRHTKQVFIAHEQDQIFSTDDSHSSSNQTGSFRHFEIHQSRVLLIHALMYMIANLIRTWIFIAIPCWWFTDIRKGTNDVLWMQGFWNLVLCVYDKSCSMHHNHQSRFERNRIWNSIKNILVSPGVRPQMFCFPSILVIPTRMEENEHNQRKDLGQSGKEEVEKEEEEEELLIVLLQSSSNHPGQMLTTTFDESRIGVSVQRRRSSNSAPSSNSELSDSNHDKSSSTTSVTSTTAFVLRRRGFVEERSNETFCRSSSSKSFTSSQEGCIGDESSTSRISIKECEELML